MAAPTVSVVIATYNRGPTIGPTLESVHRQTAPADEIVVVDDASTDGTGAWVREHYPTVRVIFCEQNGGTSTARNRGASEATGDVLVFLDHDDELLPHALATLRELLALFPEARAAYADHRYTNLVTGVHYDNHHSAQAAFARLRQIPVRRRLPQGRLYAGRAMYRALLRGNLLQQPWAIYRDTFLALGGFAPDVCYCEDWDLYLRVAEAVPLALSDCVISVHRVEGANLHLAEGQEEMQRRVMLRQLARRHWWELRARAVLRRRLGMAYKIQADRRRAWRWYVRSFLAWPFDYVVAARVCGIGIKATEDTENTEREEQKVENVIH
jgi:glycosyltransferase involved in cell wall biosynthesis